MEVEHVAQRSVRQGRAEDRDVIARRPVQHRLLVRDLQSQPPRDLAGRPVQLVFLVARLPRLLLGRFLLLQHAVEDGHQPILEGAVVAVGHQQVPNAVQSLGPETSPRGCERAQVGRGQALDQVLLHSSRRCDDGGHMAVLDEIAEGLSEPGGDQVGRVTQEDGRAIPRLGIPVGTLWSIDSPLISFVSAFRLEFGKTEKEKKRRKQKEKDDRLPCH